MFLFFTSEWFHMNIGRSLFLNKVYGFAVATLLGLATTPPAKAQDVLHNRAEVQGIVMSTMHPPESWCRPHVSVIASYSEQAYPRDGTEMHNSGLYVRQPGALRLVPAIPAYLQNLAAACPQMRSVDVRATAVGRNPLINRALMTTRLSNYTLAGGDQSKVNKLVGLVSEPVTDCDRMGGLKGDPDLPVGVEGIKANDPSWDPEAVIKACAEAIDSYGQHRRFLIQAGRALLFTGPLEHAFAYIEAAHDLGSPSATHILGEAYAEGWGTKRDIGIANVLWDLSERQTNELDGSLRDRVNAANNLKSPNMSVEEKQIREKEAAQTALFKGIVAFDLMTAPKDASVTLCNRGADVLRIGYIESVPVAYAAMSAVGFRDVASNDCMSMKNLDHRTLFGFTVLKLNAQGQWKPVAYDVPDDQLPARFTHLCAPASMEGFNRAAGEFADANPCLEGDIRYPLSFHVRVGSTKYTLDLN